MHKSSFSKLLLAILATLFAAASILYTGLWMYNTLWQFPAEMGFDYEYLEAQHLELVKSVQKDSFAERAGLSAGDRIIEVNGRPIDNLSTLPEVAMHRPGDAVELTIQRPNVPALFVIESVLRPAHPLSKYKRVSLDVGRDIANTTPVGFLVVGLAVLFLRLEDPTAWLLAVMFAGFIAIPGVPNSFAGTNPYLRAFAMFYRAVFNNMVTPLFYFFFAVFPTRSPLDRRIPWLKWIALMVGAFLAPPAVLGRFSGRHVILLCFLYGLIALSFVSLIGNAFTAPNPEARRKIRVILWGALAGVVPAMVVLGSDNFFGFHQPPLIFVAVIVLLWVFPVSFAYAVVKHQLLEIPILLKRSARYLLLQRGFTILLSVLSVSVVWIFALAFGRYLEPLSLPSFHGRLPVHPKFPVPAGIALGTAFGSLLFWVGMRVHKLVGERIDKVFFRSAYDARMILEDLAEKTRTATDRAELATLLDYHLNQALQPSSLAVYLESGSHQISAVRGNVPPELKTISLTPAIMEELERDGRIDRNSAVLSDSDDSADNPHGARAPLLLAPLHPDCLMPLLGRDSRPVGLLVLGPRFSEEPYSSDDKHLLTSVASQAGVALENIRLGEKIAEHIEAERNTAQEMEYAKRVQARLFPQKLPAMQTLEYAGCCIQARQVGGDYYDFPELSPGRLALVLADIAGKGISGALLMANLQANLRSQSDVAREDLSLLLKSVNQLFYENSGDSSYATLFFGDYDDASCRLRYVNCGHWPPLLLRADAKLERLPATATVLGLFEEWECSVAEVQLAAGDILVLYTDGVTEAVNTQDEQFGESRLIEAMLAQRHLPVSALLETIVQTVEKFSEGDQADDITLVVARRRS